jgi:hypothetical protein
VGLSVSRSIIELHNSRLWATPNDGPGATFSFSPPRAVDDPQARPLSGSGRRTVYPGASSASPTICTPPEICPPP